MRGWRRGPKWQEGDIDLGFRECAGMLEGEGHGDRAGRGVTDGSAEGLQEGVGDSSGAGRGRATRAEDVHLALCLLPQLWPQISAFLSTNQEAAPCHKSTIAAS